VINAVVCTGGEVHKKRKGKMPEPDRTGLQRYVASARKFRLSLVNVKKRWSRKRTIGKA